MRHAHREAPSVSHVRDHLRRIRPHVRRPLVGAILGFLWPLGMYLAGSLARPRVTIPPRDLLLVMSPMLLLSAAVGLGVGVAAIWLPRLLVTVAAAVPVTFVVFGVYMARVYLFGFEGFVGVMLGLLILVGGALAGLAWELAVLMRSRRRPG